MKHFFYLIILFQALSFSCMPPQRMSPPKSVDTIISMDELMEIIDTLASDTFEGRNTGSSGIEKAALYIENYLSEVRIKPFYKHFRDSFFIDDIPAYNIIGIIAATDSDYKDNYILLSAHYDHIGKYAFGEDSVFNGANDNASGVSTVLNIARILAENPHNKRNIIVALFSGEEMGLKGSEYFAQKLKSTGTPVYCALNIDMIGSVYNNEKGKVYLSGYSKSNMPVVLNQYIGSEEIVRWDKEDNYGLFSLSDNYPIYEKLNIPAHTFCTFDFKNYKHYHRVTDEPENLDRENTLIIANHIKTGVIGISKSTSDEIKLHIE